MAKNNRFYFCSNLNNLHKYLPILQHSPNMKLNILLQKDMKRCIGTSAWKIESLIHLQMG